MEYPLPSIADCLSRSSSPPTIPRLDALPKWYGAEFYRAASGIGFRYANLLTQSLTSCEPGRARAAPRLPVPNLSQLSAGDQRRRCRPRKIVSRRQPLVPDFGCDLPLCLSRVGDGDGRGRLGHWALGKGIYWAEPGLRPHFLPLRGRVVARCADLLAQNTFYGSPFHLAEMERTGAWTSTMRKICDCRSY